MYFLPVSQINNLRNNLSVYEIAQKKLPDENYG